MTIFDELKQRNVINNITNEKKLEEFIKNKPSVYVGVDPSFKSMHLGNYYTLITINRLAKAGFKPYILIGGATGLIGDPSGKKAERKVLPLDVIKNNIECLTNQIKSLFDCEIVNNYDFYKDMNILQFLRDVGKLINVNYLLEKEIIKGRLESGISYAEFSYNLVQGYDFLNLYKNHNVWMQIGGSDQWGNITTGIEMIRKVCGDDNNALGLTINLLTKEDGTKFGKSEKGAIYLDSSITSPYQMYQFLVNQTDADVKKLLFALTFISVDEINSIMNAHNEAPFKKTAQKRLAFEIVKDIHGQDVATKCEEISAKLFSGEIASLSHNDLYDALSSTPSITLSKSTNILDVLVELGVCPSKSNARTLVQSKSISINGQLIEDINFIVDKENSIDNKFSYIKKGKKNYFLINWN